MSDASNVIPLVHPMATAPTDGRMIEVFAWGEWHRAMFMDCQWMRDDPELDDIPDAWGPLDAAGEWEEGKSHIELEDALAWRPDTGGAITDQCSA